VTTEYEDDDETLERRRPWRLFAFAGVLAVATLLVWWPGCRQYPPVSSPESLSLMRLLYSACNSRDEKRLAEVEKRIEKLQAEGKLNPEERAGFDKIVGMAKAGKWEAAEKSAFKFAQDQVGQGTDTPDRH
jgi:hypothetical protein